MRRFTFDGSSSWVDQPLGKLGRPRKLQVRKGESASSLRSWPVGNGGLTMLQQLQPKARLEQGSDYTFI